MLRDFIYILAINTIIALFLTLISFGDGLYLNFVFSQSIGLSIYTSAKLTYRFYKNLKAMPKLLVIFLALTAGALIGIGVAHLITGKPLSLVNWPDIDFIQIVLMSLLFGTVVTHFFLSQKTLAEARTLAQEEKIQRLAREKESLQMHLKLLQAQVEPHFLFNTLSNIHSLLSTDVEKANQMLLDLTGYLRGSLSRSREEIITVDQEMDMIRSYLDIFKIRMGDRLHYEIQTEERIRNMPIPPMLVQPLVENSIKHGIEPSVNGGRISVAVQGKNGMLIIEVEDNGIGITDSGSSGIGISSVIDRIQSLFGEKGSVSFEDVKPHGLKITLELPYEEDTAGNNSR